jgi:hypothetical protein
MCLVGLSSNICLTPKPAENKAFLAKDDKRISGYFHWMLRPVLGLEYGVTLLNIHSEG